MAAPPDHSTSPSSPSRLGLNPEQLKWLLSKLSSDDQEEVSKIMKDCTSEMTFSRGMPFAIGTMLSMWFVRNRLPEKYWIGPKSSIPFYMLIGFGSLTAANLLSMNTCADRVRPKLTSLYEKYNNLSAEGGVAIDRYAQLRQQNRSGVTLGNILEQQRDAEASYQERKRIEDEKERAKYVWDESAPLLSGTPTSRSVHSIPSNFFGDPKSSSTSYGDKDFS
ncbi:unnamed protein product [Bursaphelenchus xylophilus]|uniref:(pine wood nematode) hypothetical protein n=1 Tax=Bursaphelenchus xylophilus TaxID=6326 RepID=A0A1I7SFU7_BURXY|nr:unnamed protein product [Bursaphelenchus xylophilus]CAG9080967.1 unnamed protein product [Bursaphelenchus xylophilus]